MTHGERKEKIEKVKTQKNIRKYETYRLAFKMIDDGMASNCPLQSIAVEESIMSDRLWSALNSTKEKGESMKRSARRWMRGRNCGSPDSLRHLMPRRKRCTEIFANGGMLGADSFMA